MITRISVTLLATLIAVPTLAAPFSFEVEGMFSQADSRFTETETLGAGGTYYFKPVDTAGAPLAEAAFTSRAGQVTLGLSQMSLDLEAPFFAGPAVPLTSLPPLPPALIDRPYAAIVSVPLPGQTDTDTHRVAARYVHPSGWLAEADLSLGRADDSVANSRLDSDSTDFSIAVGRYLLANTTVSFRYGRRTMDTVNSIELCDALPCTLPATLLTNIDDTTDIWSGRVRHLAALGSNHHAFAASVSYAAQDIDQSSNFATALTLAPAFSNKTYYAQANVSYTFYPRHDIGVGLGLNHIDAEHGSDNATSVFASWFVTERIGLRARYSEQGNVLSFEDTDTWEFGLTGRF